MVWVLGDREEMHKTHDPQQLGQHHGNLSALTDSIPVTPVGERRLTAFSWPPSSPKCPAQWKPKRVAR